MKDFRSVLKIPSNCDRTTHKDTCDNAGLMKKLHLFGNRVPDVFISRNSSLGRQLSNAVSFELLMSLNRPRGAACSASGQTKHLCTRPIHSLNRVCDCFVQAMWVPGDIVGHCRSLGVVGIW